MPKVGERYAQADKDMPPLHQNDDAALNLREVFLSARERGYARPHPRVLDQIRQSGYDHTLVMQVTTGMGQGNFPTLLENGDWDLSAEYAVWKHFMHRLEPNKQAQLKTLATQLNFK